MYSAQCTATRRGRCVLGWKEAVSLHAAPLFTRSLAVVWPVVWYRYKTRIHALFIDLFYSAQGEDLRFSCVRMNDNNIIF